MPESLLPNGIEALSGIMKDMPANVSSQVLLNRPDVTEAEHNLKSANASIGSARAAFFPSISLTASGGVGQRGAVVPVQQGRRRLVLCAKHQSADFHRRL